MLGAGLLIVAVGVAVIIFSLLCSDKQPKEQRTPAAAYQQSSEGKSNNSAGQTEGGTNNDKSQNTAANPKFGGFREWLFSNKEWIDPLGTLLLAVFTLFLFLGTLALYFATSSLVNDARDTSQRELRAYVYAQINSRVWPAPPTPTNRWSIYLTVKNSGKTWARNLRIRQARRPAPIDVPFAEVPWTEDESGRMVLGPGEEWNLQFGDIPLTELPDIESHKKRWFYLVWITYEDTLSDPPVTRQTRLYRELGADTEGIGHVSFRWMPIHNCADDDCPQ
jgi:hypothetical protein